VYNPKFSVVIPIYNEELNIHHLYRRLTSVMESMYKNEKFKLRKKNKTSRINDQYESKSLNYYYEIIMVDDGCSDRSWQIIKELNKKDIRLKGIKFSKNFGHHIAITAGIDHARGDYIIIMDGDLQDPPEEIPKLYKKINDGYDIVYAIRKARKDPFLKKFFSRFFNKLFSMLAQVKIPENSGIFRIMNRKAAESLKNCREKSRFISALISWIGFSHTGVITKREGRFSGKSKYNIFKSLLLAVNGIASFSYFPLRIATFIGSLMALISFGIGIYMIVKKIFYGVPILGYTSIIVSILFIGAIQLFLIGVLGEYIGRIYTEVQNRPIYIVKDELGF